MTEINFNITPSELGEKDTYRFSNMWEKYNLEILGHFYPQYPERNNNNLEKNGFHYGSLFKNEVDSITNTIKKQGKKVKFSNDADVNFYYTDFKNIGLEDDYNRDSKFFDLDLSLIVEIDKILGRIKIDIANQLGSPWRTQMVRLWETKKDAKKENMYGWHTDGMPHEFFKIMLYFNQLNTENGTLELKIKDKNVKFDEIDPGSYILFKNSMMFHRGVPPQKENFNRLSCEVTISRSFNYFTETVNAGNNAHWPIAPWNQALILNGLTSKDYKRDIRPNLISANIKNEHDYSNKLDKYQLKIAELIEKIKKINS